MVEKKLLGECSKGTVYAYTLKNRKGMQVTVLTLGALIQRILIPSDNTLLDVCLGFDTPDEYLRNRTFFGATIGRNCNRISGAMFEHNGNTYCLTANDGPHNLHGGSEGFDRKIWEEETIGEYSVSLCYFSPNGEEGFPGNVYVCVTYTLSENNDLIIESIAVPDQDTIINLTNHSFFNLNGGGSVLQHVLQIRANNYTVNGDGGIPTGVIRSVKGTCMDFCSEKQIGYEMPFISNTRIYGYDQNLCLDGHGLRKAAVLQGKKQSMEIYTDRPGMQLFCAPCANAVTGKNKSVYKGYCFVCLEAQAYPDAIHHTNFPSVITSAGERYRAKTIYKFL